MIMITVGISVVVELWKVVIDCFGPVTEQIASAKREREEK
jgi:hypothetical protein